MFAKLQFLVPQQWQKLLQVEGYHRLEHFPIKPLVDHDNLQVYSSHRTWYTTPSEYEDFIKNMSMQANYFLISCHECDHHFKSSEQFREHVNLNHNFVNSYQEETDFTCEHCAKTLRNKPELVKHVMRVHYQYHLEYECDQC